MTRREFFKIWESHCDDFDLTAAEGLVDAIGSNKVFTQDELDDPGLYAKVDDALGRWIIANDDLGHIFMDLEDELKDE